MSIQMFREDEYVVSSYEADFHSKLKLVSLVRFLQESAWKHANDLGFGYDRLRRNGLAWILRSFALKINRQPSWGERIKVKTWPCGLDRVRCFRDFTVFDPCGNILAEGSSSWFVIDFDTKRPKKTKDYYDIPPCLSDFPQLKTLLERKFSFEDFVHENTLVPRYSDLDVNRHVNNTNYLQWALDEYVPEFHEKFHAEELVCHYYNEALYGEEVKIVNYKEGDGSWGHAVRGEKNDDKLVEIMINWKPYGRNV